MFPSSTLKVSILHQYGLGGSGSGIYAHSLAAALSQLGSETSVLCRKLQGWRPFKSGRVFIEPEIRESAPVCYPRGELPGAPTYLDMDTSSIQAELDDIRRTVSRFVRKHDPQLLVVNHLFPFGAIWNDIPELMKSKVAFVCHGTSLNYVLRARPDLADTVRDSLSRCNATVVALNNHMEMELRRFFGRQNSPCLLRIPCGVEENLFRPRNPPTLSTTVSACLRDGFTDAAELLLAPNEMPLFLFVGRLNQDKGVLVLLDAMESSPATFRTARFLLVGDGPLCQQVSMRIARLRRRGLQVALAKYLGRRELARVYAAAKAVVAPSIGPEAFPLVLLESLASGTPLVAPDHTGFSAMLRRQAQVLEELGTDPRPYILLEIRARNLAKHLADILVQNTPPSDEVSQRLRQIVVPAFTWKTVAEKFVRITSDPDQGRICA